jgi:hypothetical protein
MIGLSRSGGTGGRHVRVRKKKIVKVNDSVRPCCFNGVANSGVGSSLNLGASRDIRCGASFFPPFRESDVNTARRAEAGKGHRLQIELKKG